MLARDQWDAAPGGVTHVPPAIHLPGQLDRIRGTEFASLTDVLAVFRGGFDVEHPPTRAYRIMDVDLVDGVLFGSGAQRHLRPRSLRVPVYRPPREAMSAAVYESWNGNRWFGVWLHEDCLTYRLAEASGLPVVATIPKSEWWHRPAYEARLAIAPRFVGDMHFDELVLFDDLSNNLGKAERARDLRSRLVGPGREPSLPGVYLMRGTGGDPRVLANERAIAERFAQELGFEILDPSNSTLDEIAAACGRARVVAGVEGSHLVHGIMMMPEAAILLVIQPPERVCSILKSLTDRQAQKFAFVVAESGTDSFTANWEDIRRTYDMAVSAQ